MFLDSILVLITYNTNLKLHDYYTYIYHSKRSLISTVAAVLNWLVVEAVPLKLKKRRKNLEFVFVVILLMNNRLAICIFKKKIFVARIFHKIQTQNKRETFINGVIQSSFFCFCCYTYYFFLFD